MEPVDMSKSLFYLYLLLLISSVAAHSLGAQGSR